MTALKADRTVQGRQRIVALRFELLQLQPKCVPESWLLYPATKDLVEKLRNKWKVREVSIVHYAKVLGPDRTAKLIGEWERKENSALPITDCEKYCNATFVRTAKSLLQMLEEISK